MSLTIPIPGDSNKTEGNQPIDKWKDAIRGGIRYRQLFGQSKAWTTYKNMYRGFWQAQVTPVNIMSSIAHSLSAQIYFRDMRVGIVPTFPGFSPNAWIIEKIDNYLIKEMMIKKEFKNMILHAFLCGTAPGIFGYDSEWGFDPTKVTGELQDQTLTSFDAKGDKIEYDAAIRPGMPWFKSISPSDFIVPWGVRDIEEAPWFAMRKMRSLADVKADPKYQGTTGLKGGYSSNLEGSPESSPEGSSRYGNIDPVQEWIELWEIHDKKTQTVKVLSLDHPQWLRDDTDFLQIDGLPTEVLVFNDDPDYFWGVPDARLISAQQIELNDIRTMASKHRKVAILKMLVDKGMMKSEELEKLLDGDIKAAAFVDAGAGGDIRKSVAFLQSHVPPDFRLAAQEVREDVREIIGFSRNQAGAFEAPSGRRSATEASIVNKASVIRVDERRDLMADILVNVIRKTNQTIFKTWTEERVIDIVGPEGKKLWVRFTGPEIASEVKYKVNPEETLPMDQRTRKDEVERVIQTLGQTPGVNQQYLIQQYARQFEWLDPKMLFPGEGPGRSPEKAITMNELRRQTSGLPSSFPNLEGGG